MAKETIKTEERDEERSRERSSSNKRGNKKSRNKSKRNYQEKSTPKGTTEGALPRKNGDYNPNWYFTDKAMAEQVTQVSFQSLAGYPLDWNQSQLDVPNVVSVFMNPCPGVIKSADYGSVLLNKNAGINLAGFRLFSELAAYTGRSAVYGPQDVSTMVLELGEIISTTEFIRRMFGVAFTLNMRNRSYPRTILECMHVDPDDLFAHFSDYRTRFNTIITMINQIPIPANVAYFDKCLKIFQELYLDAESNMAQTIIIQPWSTWILDETSYSGGTILSTTPIECQADKVSVLTTLQPMSYFLGILDNMVSTMLNSSTLNVVYTDLLNLASKKGMNFLHLDYLSEGYTVIPRYSKEVSLQMHNVTITSAPRITSLLTNPHITPYNDVYPNANINALYYNPGFQALTGFVPRTGNSFILDMETDSPDVVDRIEALRYTSMCNSGPFNSGGNDYFSDSALPDHYVVGVHMWTPSNTYTAADFVDTTIIPQSYWPRLATLASMIDWAPRFFEIDANTHTTTGNHIGDLCYYTELDYGWLKRVNEFITLALYDFRWGK